MSSRFLALKIATLHRLDEVKSARSVFRNQVPGVGGGRAASGLVSRGERLFAAVRATSPTQQKDTPQARAHTTAQHNTHNSDMYIHTYIRSHLCTHKQRRARSNTHTHTCTHLYMRKRTSNIVTSSLSALSDRSAYPAVSTTSAATPTQTRERPVYVQVRVS